MLKYLGTITQPSGETGLLKGVECSFVLKTTSIAGSYGRMIAIEMKGRDPKFTWEMVGIYRAPNDDMRVMERLAAQTGYTGDSTKCSITGGDLNLPCVDWNGNAGCNNGTQAFINSLVWENRFTQVVDSPTRGNALLNVYLVWPKSSFTPSSIVQGISGHYGEVPEVEWEENCVPQVERLDPMYQI